MAMMDDPAFLISHIRNSFITSDETGMCELVIETDDLVDRSPPVNDKKYTNDRRYATWHGKGYGRFHYHKGLFQKGLTIYNDVGGCEKYMLKKQALYQQGYYR